MESDEILEVKDDSRPFYQRRNSRIGLCLTVYEAKPEDSKEYGSKHFFLMSLKDKLSEYFNELDLVKAKGVMEKRNVCKGVILEKFETDLVLTLAFDNPDALESIWKIYSSQKLSPLIQDMFIDPGMLKTVGASKITLHGRLWEDEYDDCKVELLTSGMQKINIRKTQNGVNMVLRLREAQKSLQKFVLKARDAEAEFDRKLGDFILEVKKMLPVNVTSINSLKEFIICIKMAKGASTDSKGFEHINQYLKTLEMFREIFAEIEQTVLYPLAQIHAICETDNQRLSKKSVMDTHAEMLKRLKTDQDLQKVIHREWEIKVLFREQKLFFGLVSLVPMSLEKIVDIDHMVDEYITDYPDKLKL